MAHDVFISYSHTDKPTADAACATLESRGIRCWIAPRDVLPGDEYASALVGAIHSSRLLVLVFSSGANQSPQVLREVERAVSKGLPILPLRIEDVAPSAAMEYYISSRHWLDALTTPLEQHLVQLADTVTLLLARSPGGSPPAAPASAVRPVPPPAVEPAPPVERPAPAAFTEPPVAAPAGPASVESARPAAASPKPAPAPPAPPDPRLAGRGRVAIAALVIIAVLASMRGWETILMPVFGWSDARLAALSVLRLGVLAVAFVLGGLRLRTTSPRTLATMAALLFGGGMMLLAMAAASQYVPVAAEILTAAGTGLGFIAAISLLMTWFPDRRGMVAGLAALAFGLGGFGQRTLVTWFGFIALPAAGLLALVLVLLAARALKFPDLAEAGTKPSATLREAVASPAWRILWVLLFLNTGIGWSIAYRPPGFGMTDPGTAPRIFTLLAALGSLLWPWLSDRFGTRRILLVVIGGQALFLVALFAAHADVLVLLAMLLNGGGLGLMPVLAADAFGTDDFGAVYGLLLSGWCLALQAAPAFLWWGSDRGRAGVAALLLLGAVAAVHRLLRPPARA